MELGSRRAVDDLRPKDEGGRRMWALDAKCGLGSILNWRALGQTATRTNPSAGERGRALRGPVTVLHQPTAHATALHQFCFA